MIIIDSFIKNKRLLEFAAKKDNWIGLEDSAFYPIPCYIELKKGTTPRTPWEEIALYILHHPATDLEKFKPGRLEYWSNTLTPGDELDWHQDKDEAYAEETGIVVNPLIGTIFYGYPHEVHGGYLEVVNRKGASQDLERIEPVYNRLVIFDVSKFHRVAPIIEGERYGFQVNLW